MRNMISRMIDSENFNIVFGFFIIPLLVLITYYLILWTFLN